MAIYYSVDLKGKLHSGCLVTLGQYELNKATLVDFMNMQYPDGISMHGCNYLYNPEVMMSENTPVSSALVIGLVFELVRKAHFPEKPSRYQSLFACENINEVQKFRDYQVENNGDNPAANIYEVVSNHDVHRGDMKLLDTDCPVLELYRRAFLYWSGSTDMLYDGYEPFWEILIPLPAFIGKKVAEG